MAEFISSGTFDSAYPPIVTQRAPTTSDRKGPYGPIEIGTLWIDKPNNDAYILTSVVANVATWINIGGGTGTFAALTVNPGNAVITAGNLTVTAGNFAVSAGTVTFGAFGKGILFSSAAGLISSSAGTNGQIPIGKTGDAPLWATLTAGAGINITNGANSIQIDATGATAVKYTTDDANIVVPDGTGNVNVVGGSNLSSTGAIANTVTLDLNPSVSITGKLTAGNDLEMTTGTCLIASDDNAANAIYLHANGGVNEQINIFSDQGTGVDSVWVHSDVGGLTLASGLASADAINITASNAAGGIDVDYGTNGINFAGANGAFTVTSGTAAISIGADAAAHDVTLGGTTGASSLTLQAGTGATTITAGGVFDVNAVGLLTLDSSGGRIDIGANAVAQNINIGTGAAARTITVGNSTGASSVILDCGTGAFDLGVTATDHTSRLGSTTGVSALTLQAGTGAMTFTAGGAFDVNAVGAVTIDSTGGAISIGNGADAFAVNLGTGAAARTVTIGNATGATSVVVNSGTGNLDLGVNATDHSTRVGSTTGVSALTLQAGTGAIGINGGGDITVDAVGTVEINSSAAAIRIGNDAVAQDIAIGTGAAARTITLGNATGATSVVVNGGTGAMQFGANAVAHATTIGSTTGAAATTVQAGTGGIALNAAGIVTMLPATDTQAAAAVTINANVGVGTFTGITTAAGSSQDFTINNSLVTATSAILCTLANKGANDAQMTVQRVLPGTGSFVVTAKNNGAAALNGDVIITFWVIKAS